MSTKPTVHVPAERRVELVPLKTRISTHEPFDGTATLTATARIEHPEPTADPMVFRTLHQDRSTHPTASVAATAYKPIPIPALLESLATRRAGKRAGDALRGTVTRDGASSLGASAPPRAGSPPPDGAASTVGTSRCGVWAAAARAAAATTAAALDPDAPQVRHVRKVKGAPALSDAAAAAAAAAVDAVEKAQASEVSRCRPSLRPPQPPPVSTLNYPSLSADDASSADGGRGGFMKGYSGHVPRDSGVLARRQLGHELTSLDALERSAPSRAHLILNPAAVAPGYGGHRALHLSRGFAEMTDGDLLRTTTGAMGASAGAGADARAMGAASAHARPAMMKTFFTQGVGGVDGAHIAAQFYTRFRPFGGALASTRGGAERTRYAAGMS